MPILKLSPNKPYTLALRYTQPKDSPGKYGMQFMYTLSNGSILYLPPVAHQEIQSLHLGIDEPFTIQHTITNGNAATWNSSSPHLYHRQN